MSDVPTQGPDGPRVLLELERSPQRRLCVESAGGVVHVLLHAGPLRARLDLTTAEAHELAGTLVAMAVDPSAQLCPSLNGRLLCELKRGHDGLHRNTTLEWEQRGPFGGAR